MRNSFFKIIKNKLKEIANSFTYKFTPTGSKRNPLSKMIGIPLALNLLYNLERQSSNTMRSESVSQQKFSKVLLKDADAMKEGEMREVKYGNKPGESILVVKLDSRIHVLSNKCPHYGAPLDKGFLFDHMIKCPWHGASFDVNTGLCETAPALEGLNKYETVREDNKLYALVNVSTTKKGKIPQMAKRDPKNATRYVIIGGGPAGLSCAETLRQAGYTGEIQIFSEESLIPYDRPSLSKGIPQDFNTIALRDENFLKEFDIEVISNAKVVAIDNTEHILKLNNGQTKNYDKLLIATGSSPRVPLVEGYNLNNVYTLRNYFDIVKIKQAALNSRRIVIVGGSFIGMELASTLKQLNKNAEIVIIERKATPFLNILGRDLGNIMKLFFEENKIKFILSSELTSLIPKTNTGNVGKVGYKKIKNEENENYYNSNSKSNNNLKTDEEFEDADMVILGTGVDPNTEILDKVVLLENNFVKCDPYLATSDPNIFAAGDICSIPSIFSGERISSAHYINAQQQGSIAALNMLGKNILYDYVPFFWTRFFNKTIQFVGQFDKFDDVYLDGNINSEKSESSQNSTKDFSFGAYFLQNNRVVGFAAMDNPNSANIMYELFRHNYLVTGNMLKNKETDIKNLEKIVKTMQAKCSKVDCLCSCVNKNI